MAIKRYDKFKDSGVKWLGKIPEGWGIEKGKWLFNEEDRPVRVDDEIVTCFRDGQVTLRRLRKTEGFTNSLKEIGYQGIRKGDLVIHNMDAFAGAIGIAEEDGKSTPVYSVCTQRIADTLHLKYYSYFLRNLALRGFILSLAKGIRERSTDFRFSDLGVLELPKPTFAEQQAISEFLDDKTAKIDQLIAIKEKEINLLKERRQILIQKAVTKGLDPNVRMKDSGVDWIGEIPEHWEVRKLRFEFNLSKGLTITKENLTEEGIFCVNYGEIHSKYGFEVNPEIHKLKCVPEEYLLTNPNAILAKGDFIFADTSEDLEGSGNFTYLNSDKLVFAGYHTVIARPKNNIDSRFIAYEFDSVRFRNQIRTKMKGVKVFSITQSILKGLSVWLPPLQEQIEIKEFLDKASSKIDKAISIKHQEIEKLKEYKTVLIDNVVTGKVKVN